MELDAGLTSGSRSRRRPRSWSRSRPVGDEQQGPAAGAVLSSTRRRRPGVAKQRREPAKRAQLSSERLLAVMDCSGSFKTTASVLWSRLWARGTLCMRLRRSARTPAAQSERGEAWALWALNSRGARDLELVLYRPRGKAEAVHRKERRKRPAALMTIECWWWT
jgi:hypothetical protein